MSKIKMNARRVANSLVMTLPASVCRFLSINEGDLLEVEILKVNVPKKRKART
ncbi:MAG TPA: hypothetical protein VKE88_03370 [Candidatus Nanoarchaeia archaeon]|nr:hypothetical protein [Candidatus Nanoarchaeia archaeon]